jgi:hypothetical protein
MKTIAIFLVFFLLVSSLAAQEDSLAGSQLTPVDRQIAFKAEHTLHHALAFNTTTIAFTATGSVALGIGTAIGEGLLIIPGMAFGIGGIDMGKFSPIPLAQAKKIMSPWSKDPEKAVRFAKPIKYVNTAMTLSVVSLLFNAAGEVLVVVSLFQHYETDSYRYLRLSAGFVAVGVLTSVGSSVMIQKARKSLKGLNGKVGLDVGPDGLGISYKFPGK